jgi:hypothetical protein
MNAVSRRWLPRTALLGAVTLIVLFIAKQLNNASLDADSPRPIAWDDEACADCHMHIGEPKFAAQIVTERGDALSFDDPGCLLRYVSRERLTPRAVYFHHLREDRWLRAPKVAFVAVAHTPMGYNLGAVDPGTSGASTYQDGLALVTSRAENREAVKP